MKTFSAFQCFVLAFMFILLTACTAEATPTDTNQAATDASPTASPPLAQETLVTFFALLHQGRYEEAIPLYGGDYELMQTWNLDVDPADAVTLWQYACEFNGLMCLPILNIVSQTQISPTEIHFLVEFQNDDGSRFILGPCCGTSEEDMPPVSQFEYTVVLGGDGQYRVVELPVYVP